MVGRIFGILRRAAPHLKKAGRALHYLNYRAWEKEKKHSFIINVSIGVIVGLAFFPLLRLQLMEKTLNRTMDWMVKKEASAVLKCSGPSAGSAACERLKGSLWDRIVFIDIDSDTYVRKWGEPLLIPRTEIARFLALADKNGARVVALDTLFDYPSFDPRDDAALRRVLEDLTERKSSLKIVFPAIQRSTDKTIKGNIFDDIIKRNPNFHIGLPYGSVSTGDRVTRYIHYYEVVKGPDGGNTVVWTVPVLTTALFTDDFQKLKAAEPQLLKDHEARRNITRSIGLSNKTVIQVGNNEIFSNRIRFAYFPPGALNEEGNVGLGRILPEEADAQQEDLKDKVVIIGTSCPDKEAWQRTPAGDIPGMYVIGSATNVLIGNRQVRGTPFWVVLVVDMTVILFACYMFVHWHPAVARTIAMVFGSLLLLPATYYFYLRFGIVIDALFLFVNLLVPIMAMGWYGIHNNAKRVIFASIRRLFGRY